MVTTDIIRRERVNKRNPLREKTYCYTKFMNSYAIMYVVMIGPMNVYVMVHETRNPSTEC